jgi:hypothetical protein
MKEILIAGLAGAVGGGVLTYLYAKFVSKVWGAAKAADAAFKAKV